MRIGARRRNRRHRPRHARPEPSEEVDADRSHDRGAPASNGDGHGDARTGTSSCSCPTAAASLSKGDEVPSYTQWYAAPGAVVPAVVNPKDTGAASIDWPAFALAQFDQAGFDDDPPRGQHRGRDRVDATATGATQTTQAGGRRDVRRVRSDGPVTLDATMQGWIDALRRRLHEAQGLRQGARRLAGGRDVHACPGRRRREPKRDERPPISRRYWLSSPTAQSHQALTSHHQWGRPKLRGCRVC